LCPTNVIYQIDVRVKGPQSQSLPMST